MILVLGAVLVDGKEWDLHGKFERDCLRVMGAGRNRLGLASHQLIHPFLFIGLKKFPFNFKSKNSYWSLLQAILGSPLGMLLIFVPNYLVSPMVDPRGMLAMLGNSP